MFTVQRSSRFPTKVWPTKRPRDENTTAFSMRRHPKKRAIVEDPAEECSAGDEGSELGKEGSYDNEDEEASEDKCSTWDQKRELGWTIKAPWYIVTLSAEQVKGHLFSQVIVRLGNTSCLSLLSHRSPFPRGGLRKHLPVRIETWRANLVDLSTIRSLLTSHYYAAHASEGSPTRAPLTSQKYATTGSLS